jgi:putative DNA methylase
MTPPRVLIEDWFPIEELGIESQRERAAASALPPLYFLHVWWARRPLVASRAAVLGSLMPQWTSELGRRHPAQPELQSPEAYGAWFLRLCGILGDPVVAIRLLESANERGERVEGGYGYPPAYRNRLGIPDLELLHELLRDHWGGKPAVLDPTAGGGSIPYEAIRLGLPATANDLNGVAAAILTASLVVPGTYGPELATDLKRWGKLLADRIGSRVQQYFPLPGYEQVVAYIFARTVACPRTGKPVPLSPNWWLAKGDVPVAVRLVTEVGGETLDSPRYEIARGREVDFDPDQGTVAGGDAISPWDGLAIPGEYIKSEAKAGRLGSDLYAVAFRTLGGRGFRAPTDLDLEGLARAARDLEATRAAWVRDGTIPDDQIPLGNDMRPVEYGMATWADMFSPRGYLSRNFED